VQAYTYLPAVPLYSLQINFLLSRKYLFQLGLTAQKKELPIYLRYLDVPIYR